MKTDCRLKSDSLSLLLALALAPLASLYSTASAAAVAHHRSEDQTLSKRSPLSSNLLEDSQLCSHILSQQECGYLGITEDQCLQRQCCWNPVLATVPRCFEKKVLLHFNLREVLLLCALREAFPSARVVNGQLVFCSSFLNISFDECMTLFLFLTYPYHVSATVSVRLWIFVYTCIERRLPLHS